MSTKSTLRKKRTRASSSAHITVPSSSAHTTVPSIAHSTQPTTISPHTASPSAASTVPQGPPTTVLTKTTRKRLTISESRLWHRRLAHNTLTALRSLIDGYTKTTQCVPHASRPSTSRRSTKSRPSALHSHLNSYIRTCADHFPRPPPLAIATISYSSMTTHDTPPFGSFQI